MATTAKTQSSRKEPPRRFHFRDYTPRIWMRAHTPCWWVPEFPITVAIHPFNPSEMARALEKTFRKVEAALASFPLEQPHPIPFDYVVLGMESGHDPRRDRLKVPAIAKLLGCSEQTARRLLDRGGGIPSERRRGETGERTASLQAVLRYKLEQQRGRLGLDPLEEWAPDSRGSRDSPPLRIAEEAKRLGVSRATYWRWRKAGKVGSPHRGPQPETLD